MNVVANVARFALVSGFGLGLDFLIFLALLSARLSPLEANTISAAGAVTFVYFASVRRIFSYNGRFLARLFLAYLAYQLVAIALASVAVDILSREFTSPLISKLLILPVTFCANYGFMSLLTRGGRAAD